jgi:S-DNA-T family DNA segregation ATPase FtsK/SpoIIIE
MLPAHERIPLPVIAPAPARPGLPVVAMLAPVALAIGMWIMTSSPFALLFALLGPIMALASALDGRRTARRARRRELATARTRLAELELDIGARLRARVAALAEIAPPLERLAFDPSRTAWRIGTGDVPSGIELASGDEAPELAAEVARLRERAAWLRDAAVVVDDADEFVLTGAAALTRALARSLVLQAVARCAPGTAHVVAPADEGWTARLPARCDTGEEWRVDAEGRQVLAIRGSAGGARAVELHLGEAGEEPWVATGASAWRPCYLAAVEAAVLACRLADEAYEAGWRPPSAIPAGLGLDELLDEPVPRASAALLGVGAEGIVTVDLEQHGPHALVAGTTGSGKSELLVSWVLALASRRPPRELAFLLIDFKGGASFSPLAALPHVAGVVSDLDAGGALRAVESLRAEVRRREAVLAAHGVRDIVELDEGVLPRLVIVVDEFAALIALDGELHSLFADLAARGRSLGLHLILGTQRPAGVVRDAVLANVTVRVCLRVLEAGESTAVVGRPDAARIPADRPGRGVLQDGFGAREVQFARADAGLVARVAERWSGHPAPDARTWLEPLPALVTLDELPRALGPSIGLVDIPDEQRREGLVVDPWRDGALLVLGASGSGRTHALAAIASRAAPAEVRWIAGEPAELWAALVTRAVEGRTLVVADDLDLVLARCDAEQRTELAELMCRAARETRTTGIAIVASSRGAGGALQAAATAFEQRMLLRLPSREEHLLGGGDAASFRADRRPGSAVWRGREAQLAMASARVPPWHAELEVARLADGGWGLATSQPERWLERLSAAGIAAFAVGRAPGEAAVLVGDVEAWLAEHAALTEFRRAGRLLLSGCSRAELRALTRSRGAAPPLAGEHEAWRIDGVAATRVRLDPDAVGELTGVVT